MRLRESPWGALPPGPPAGASPLHPTPFSLLRQRKGGKRKAGLLRSPLACGEGFPALLAKGPRAELACVRCAHSAQTGCASQMASAPSARRPLVCAARRRRRRAAANSQQPNLGLWTAGSERIAGCWEPPFCAAEQRRNPGGARSARRVLASRSLFERSEPQASAVSSARPPGSEQRRAPVWPQAKRASATGSPFFSPLFFGEAKKRGSGFGAEGPKPTHTARRSHS